MKVFTVCRVSFEYNGDYNYSYDGTGEPCKGFRSEQKAREECDRMIREACSEHNPGQFHPPDETLWEEDQYEKIRTLLDRPDMDTDSDDTICDEWDTFTDDQRVRLWEISNATNLFYVHEIEIEDCQVREPVTN